MSTQKIGIVYEDGTTEVREVIKNSIPETTLKAARETGKSVIKVLFSQE